MDLEKVRVLKEEWKGDDYNCNIKLFKSLDEAIPAFKQAVHIDMKNVIQYARGWVTDDEKDWDMETMNLMMELEFLADHEKETERFHLTYEPDNFYYHYYEMDEDYFTTITLKSLPFSDLKWNRSI